MADARPRVLAVLPALFPSTIIGVAKPLQRMHRAGRIDCDLTLQCLVRKARVARADVVVLCHTIDPQFGGIMEWARGLGKPVIYEIDDNLLEIPPHVRGLNYLREPARRAQLEACLRQADTIRVYAPALQAYLSRYNPNIEVVSGPLDWRLVPDIPAASGAGPVRLVYATSRQQDSIGQMLLGPLQRALETFPAIELTVWGPRLEPLSRHPRVRTLPLIRDYDRFFARFAREGFDVGLAPLPDDLFHRCKSNNKFREYGACGVAGIYSDTPVYNTGVVDGQTGLLAGNREGDWHTAIARLITDAELRRRIARDARETVRRLYNEQATDAAWMAQITALAGRAATSPAPGRAAAVARPFESAAGLASHAVFLGKKVLPVIRRHGLADTSRRIQGNLSGLAQLLWWKLRDWRMGRAAGGSAEHA